jgi:hypothetical protein
MVLNNGRCDVTIIGVGGAGSGVVLALAGVPYLGHIAVWDPQIFATENMSGQVLCDQTVVGQPKADVAVNFLKTHLPNASSVKAYVKRFGRRPHYPIVISAVDTKRAREDIARYLLQEEIRGRLLLYLDLCLSHTDPYWYSVEVGFDWRHPEYADWYLQRLAVKEEAPAVESDVALIQREFPARQGGGESTARSLPLQWYE